MIQSLPGTFDILPDQIPYWDYLLSTARTILSQAAYREIRTPLCEATELFQRSIGEATDVVGKEMYTFEDRGGRWTTLRPEGTAGVARCYVEHHLGSLGRLQRLWYSGAMFRYERPQAGRQRQFHQLGVEVLGSSDPRGDAEVIALANDILQALKLTDLHLDLNSVGTPEDRRDYRQALVDYLNPYQGDLDPDSQDRLERNPLRILDSKHPRTQEIVQAAPCLLDFLSPASRHHFDQVQFHLESLHIPYTINPRLVRGLDYYTHTAFEIKSSALGAQDTVCGGGRYDGLIAQLGGDPTAAVGWAMGLERLVLLLQKLLPPPQDPLDFYLISRGPAAEARAIVFARQLRQAGYGVELDLSGSAFGKQFKRADRSGAVASLVLGEQEAQTGAVQLKWLASGQQQLVPQAQLLQASQVWQAQLRNSLNSLQGGQDP